MDERDGVWRTIRGRRVFIAKGESLGQAMSKSGKFKSFNRNDFKQTKDVLSRNDKVENAIKKYKGNGKVVENISHRENLKKDFTRDDYEENLINRQAPKNRINENAEVQKFWDKRVLRNYDKYSETDKREIAHENLQKRLADYKAKKQSNNKVDNQDMPYERDLQDVVKSLNDEGSDFSWSINEYKDGKASLNVGVFMPDERGYVDRNVEFDLKGIKGNTAEGYSQIEDKIREWQDKHNSPDSFYDNDYEAKKYDKQDEVEKIKAFKEKKQSNINLGDRKKQLQKEFQKNQSKINGYKATREEKAKLKQRNQEIINEINKLTKDK